MVRILPIRTISGRIVLGFLLLTATFSAVSGYALYKMNELSRELRFLRTAYLEVSVEVAKLQSLQTGVVDYLGDSRPLRPLIDRNLAERQRLASGIAGRLASVTGVPSAHRRVLEDMQATATRFLRDLQANRPHYDTALGPTADPTAARAALARVRQNEARLQKRATAWFRSLRDRADYSASRLERAEEQARVGGIVLAAIAALVGLLVTVWAVLTLRPIRHLRDGARRVAGGDYKGRVEVAGGTELAEVAREFNVMAQAIEEREGELVRSARLAAVGKMAAIITHEIRNPLSSIGLNTELLEDELGRPGVAAPEATGLLRAIHKEVDRLTAITEEYLRFARLPRPRLDEEQANDVVRDLVEFQKEELALARIEVVAELEPGLPPVLIDEAQLRQALLNLVRNAADAMASTGGRLHVATRRAGAGGVEITVADSGPGIAPEHLERIFEPFFSTKERGTGLGLALTQQIVLEHGGRIEVSSRVGEGTRFVVRLPEAPAAGGRSAERAVAGRA